MKEIDLIDAKEDLIEKTRLAIKEIKNQKAKILNRIEEISNIYEYLAAPACASSIALTALFTGTVVYVLPALTTLTSIGITTYKYKLRKKLEKLDKMMAELKEKRQKAYDERERVYEDIFKDLQNRGMDVEDYYTQLVDISNDCNALTSVSKPYKDSKKKLANIRSRLTNIFDVVLVPLSAVILPLTCSALNTTIVQEVVVMGASSALLFSCASINERLTRKIDDLEDTISDIKTDRTVKYVQRDLKLKDALNFLENNTIKR